jgi:hypothetical protein
MSHGAPRRVSRWGPACVLALVAACASAAGPARPAPAAGPVEVDSGEVDSPAQGQPCQGGKCAPGLTCLRYFGIAGPRGPAFSSCEIPCLEARSVCPEGQTCVTVADGPGRVCNKTR